MQAFAIVEADVVGDIGHGLCQIEVGFPYYSGHPRTILEVAVDARVSRTVLREAQGETLGLLTTGINSQISLA